MKKILFLVAASVFVSGMVFADVTVEEVRSPEYMKNEGYSTELINTVQIESGEYNPQKSSKWKKYGFKIWNYFDDASPKAQDDYYHDIKPYNSWEDL